MDKTKIISCEFENVKRIKVVELQVNEDGLTIIGGKNGQGKTSVLDAIAWTLGGDRYRPSEPKREGSLVNPATKITLSNGLVVERTGKNSDLKVTDPEGARHGQTLLNSFIEEFALNLPKFLHSNGKDKARTLLQLLGIEDQLNELKSREEKLYNKRLAVGQICNQKKGYFAVLPHHPDAPKELVSASDLIKQQQDILQHNARNQALRQQHEQLRIAHLNASQKHADIVQKIEDLNEQKATLEDQISQLLDDLETSTKTVKELQDESTAEIEESLLRIEQTNEQVRDNQKREEARLEAEALDEEYKSLSEKIRETRQKQIDLLNGADLPLPELSVVDGELTYRGQQWDNMSGAEQLKVATAIVQALNPQCGFVLLDGLEQMDLDTLAEFGAWLQEQDLQVIATRVSTGDECSIILEDGYALPDKPEKPLKQFKEGVF